MSNTCFSNRVVKNSTREAHRWTLLDLSNCVFPSAGPLGSTTQIIRSKVLNSGAEFKMDAIYTKDGRTIADAVMYSGAIENSVQKEMVHACDAIDDEVGDGTTSIILLSAIVYDKLCELEQNIPPYMIIRYMKEIVEEAKALIEREGHELTLGDVFDIAMISTNSNVEMSNIITNIYKDFGKGAFIEVETSADSMHHIKDYRGLTLSSGYSDTCYVNEIKTTGKEIPATDKNGVANNIEDVQGMSIINNASIYAFIDPIDTPEMANYLNTIIEKNIIEPYNGIQDTYQNPYEYTDPEEARKEYYAQMRPTVILAPKIGLDLENSFNKVATMLHPIPTNQRPPLLVVTNIDDFEMDTYVDIFTLCGCKSIKKYIDPALQQADIKAGLACTPEDAAEFCAGHCEQVKADSSKTIFINPSEMFVKDEDGKFKTDEKGEFIKGNQYKVLVNMVEGELKKAIAENSDYNTIGNLRKRLNALKGTLVQLFVGGVTTTDRDSVKDLVVDAVKNIRSASSKGVGYGANFQGLKALHQIDAFNADEYEDAKREVFNVLYNAYIEAGIKLYGTMYIPETKGMTEEKRNEYIKNHFVLTSVREKNMPFNIATNEWDGKVKCSIQQDIAIMDTIAKVISVMFTTNQALLSSWRENTYRYEDKSAEKPETQTINKNGNIKVEC